PLISQLQSHHDRPRPGADVRRLAERCRIDARRCPGSAANQVARFVQRAEDQGLEGRVGALPQVELLVERKIEIEQSRAVQIDVLPALARRRRYRQVLWVRAPVAADQLLIEVEDVTAGTRRYLH